MGAGCNASIVIAFLFAIITVLIYIVETQIEELEEKIREAVGGKNGRRVRR